MSRPTTLSSRAAQRLADGPLDPVTLMRDVCRVEQLQPDAAERMAIALLSSHPEFVRLPSGHWALRPGLASAVVPGVSLRDVAFAVTDVETTGTRATDGDRITEIAIARVQGGQIVDVYAQLVNPQRSSPPYITQLTQISWNMVKDQPTFRDVAPQVEDRLAGHVFTAHNAAFDWRFVGEELYRSHGQRLSGPRLCTVRMAR
ncbi:MAG: exonuclease domain-containing protein, partial [Gemmatimonadota bacterium]|nr:exonuclease domain-containing protein [Gemmatimonadota bacterium]